MEYRGGALPIQSTSWDSNGKNDWAIASANSFLNGDYLLRTGGASNYGIKGLSRSQIDNVNYYLGGTETSSDYSLLNFGNGEEIYEWERGVEVYSGNHTLWNGDIAFMYTSDFIYTYAKGVNDICYNYSSKCHSGGEPAGDPTTGWIYNSNISELYSSPTMIWHISSASNYQQSVFFTANNGWTVTHPYYPSSAMMDFRPVLYLKPTIKIYSGDGSENNPYCLQENCTKQQYYNGQQITYNGEKYNVMNITDDYLTLLKVNPLTADEINAVSTDYVSENGEYPYLINDSCDSDSNNLGCYSAYSGSSVKKIIDRWSSNFSDDLVSVDGYKARLINDDDNIFDKEVNPSSVHYRFSSNTPSFISDPSSYWSSISLDDSGIKVYVIQFGLSQYNVYDKKKIRPVINLKRCVLEDGCSTESNNDGNNDEITNAYTFYRKGENITYKNNDYCVIKDSLKNVDYVTVIKNNPLTNDELVTYNNGYEIGRNNDYNDIGIVSFYKSNSCYYNDENDKNLTSCNSSYNDSFIKNIVNNWSSSISNDLKEVNGYKARLISIDDLFGLGYSIDNRATENLYLKTDDVPECIYNSNYSYNYWTMSRVEDSNKTVYIVNKDGNVSGYYGDSRDTYFERDHEVYSKNAIRPVINLKKCAIDNTCE